MSRYVSLVPLGSGGMGDVSLGVLLGVAGYRRPVVLKRAKAGADERALATQRYLVREALVASTLNHPNVVHVYELTDAPEGLTLAMEYLPGVSAQGLVAELAREGGAIPWPVAARIVADAARGLHHAHRARAPDGTPLSIVHRDVSPKNLLVTEEGITKVLDFGIARSTLRPETAGSYVLGTAGYLSPEQARGQTVDWRSDVFSLGITLHELLTLRNPFERGSLHDTMEAILVAPPPPLPSSIPAPLTDLVARMLTKDPAHRRLDMAEIADALDALASVRGGTHRYVAAFLAAELGGQLDARRERLRDLLAGAAFDAPARRDGETGTLALLEHVLDNLVIASSDEHRALAEADELTGSLTERDPYLGLALDDEDVHTLVGRGRKDR